MVYELMDTSKLRNEISSVMINLFLKKHLKALRRYTEKKRCIAITKTIISRNINELTDEVIMIIKRAMIDDQGKCVNINNFEIAEIKHMKTEDKINSPNSNLFVNFYKNCRDNVLMELVKIGNEQAIVFLFDYYAKFCTKIANNLIGSRFYYCNTQVAKEVVEEKFNDIWKNCQGFGKVVVKNDGTRERKFSFFAWINTSIENQLMTKNKKLTKYHKSIVEIKKNDPEYDESLHDYLERLASEKGQVIHIDILSMQAKELFERKIQYLLFKTRLDYPWKIIVYALWRLKNTPAEIVSKNSSKTMEELFNHLKSEYCRIVPESSVYIDPLFSTLETSIQEPVRIALHPSDSKTKKILNDYLDKKVNNLKLDIFLGQKNPVKTITDWHKRTDYRLFKLMKEINSSEWDFLY